jgi:hypothetical protein
MIHVKELRIGNKVKCTISNDAGIYTILAIPEWIKEMSQPIVIDRCPKQTVPIDRLRGIKLTPELLVEYGFKQDRIYKYMYSIETFIIHKMATDSKNKPEVWQLALDYGHSLNTEIDYFHQLQNLYYYLTGKELEYNL